MFGRRWRSSGQVSGPGSGLVDPLGSPLAAASVSPLAISFSFEKFRDSTLFHIPHHQSVRGAGGLRSKL